MSAPVLAAVVWALAAAGFSMVAVWRVRRSRETRACASAPAVLLVRPVDALTALEVENLCAPVAYAGGLEHVIVSSSRPAVPRHLGFLESHPACPNRKVAHVLAALAAHPHASRVVLVVDADVRVTGDLVSALARAVQSGAALSFAAPEPSPGQGLAARAVRALLVRSHHSFRALDVMSAGPKAICGKAVGLGPVALALLPNLTDVVGEDLELAQRLFALGQRVELVAPAAQVPQRRPSTTVALARFTRWMQVLKAHRPCLYPTVPLFFTPTLPLVALAIAAGSGALWASIAALVFARTTLAWALLPAGRTTEWLVDWLLAEALLLAAFIRALVARRLIWRGRAFALRRGGRMVPT